MTRSRRLLVIVFVLVGVACSDVPTQPAAWDIEIEMEVGGGQRWSTTGQPVGAGSICEEGAHRNVGYRSLDGSPIAYDQAIALTQTHPDAVLLETQLGCADGSGVISIAWRADDGDRWMIVGGTGAYSASTGGGHVERPDASSAGTLILSGEISSG